MPARDLAKFGEFLHSRQREEFLGLHAHDVGLGLRGRSQEVEDGRHAVAEGPRGDARARDGHGVEDQVVRAPRRLVHRDLAVEDRPPKGGRRHLDAQQKDFVTSVDDDDQIEVAKFEAREHIANAVGLLADPVERRFQIGEIAALDGHARRTGEFIAFGDAPHVVHGPQHGVAVGVEDPPHGPVGEDAVATFDADRHCIYRIVVPRRPNML